MNEHTNQNSQRDTAISELPGCLHHPPHIPLFILDGFRSAYNVGSAFRTAEAVSPSAVILCGVSARPGNRKLAHTARGTQRMVPWRYFSKTCDAAAWAGATGRRIVAVETREGGVPIFSAPFGPGDAFVFGNEAEGVSEDVLGISDIIVHFVQTGRRNCMNVAGIVSIVAAEVQRRRGSGPPRAWLPMETPGTVCDSAEGCD